MPETLVLEDGRTRVQIVPELGGSIATMEALLPGGPAPVLRPWTGRSDDGPFVLGANVLVPFSNRISGGGFLFDQVFHAIPPNLEGEPFPIHGDGFQHAWSVRSNSKHNTMLVLEQGKIGPFSYQADMAIALTAGKLLIELSITNHAGRPLPYGAGFHPWFPRSSGTLLQFGAKGVWLEDENHLPTDHIALDTMPTWDFSDGAALPEGWINNAFTGWLGKARIVQRDLGITVQVEASSNMDTAIVFSPEKDAGFFCFEPVTHAVDAHNQAGYPGLAILADDQSLSVAMTFDWAPL